jgi:hypothetical protein
MRNKVLKAHLWIYLRGTTYRQGSKTSHEGLADAPAPESPGGGYDGGGGGGGDAGWSVPLVIISTLLCSHNCVCVCMYVYQFRGIFKVAALISQRTVSRG